MTDAPPLPARTTGPALRNTLSRRVEPVPLPQDGPVRMYTCGPTVYRWAHVGNLRSYLLADLIRRTFLYHGDPGAPREEHHGRRAPARRAVRPRRGPDAGRRGPRIQDAGRDRRRLRGRVPRGRGAGQHPAGARLPAGDRARARHARPGVAARGARARLPLGRRATSTTRSTRSPTTAGCRATPSTACGRAIDGEVEPDKRDAADFALWKAAGEGRILRWPSPWGDGFPGWHLECSAMALRYLGPGFEIHTGGIDNVFPHHEDEIAQSTPVAGGPPVRHWVHGEHLLASGRKMAKSTGNFERVTELRDRGIDPLAFRYLTLTVRYGRKLNYSPPSIEAAAAALGSLRAHLAALGPPPADGPFAAPPALRAGSAGPRPTGIATGVAGHQADARWPRRPTSPSPTARTQVAAPLSPAALRAPRPLRRRHRRRPRPADGPRGGPRGAPDAGHRGGRAPVAGARRRSRARARPRPRLGGRGRCSGLPRRSRRGAPGGCGGAARGAFGGARGTGLEPRRRAARRPRGAGDRGRRRRRRAPRGAAARPDLRSRRAAGRDASRIA